MTIPSARVAAGNAEAAIRGRRSTIRLAEPAPGPDELLDLLTAAATAPDHGQLRPWRMIAISGDARARLAQAAAEAAPTAAVAQRITAKHLRAPLLLALVFQPRDHPTIPRWEQLAATSAMATTLLLLLDARGWGGVWFGGPYPDAPQVRKHLGIGDGEQLLGYLYVGTPIPSEVTRPRAAADVRSKLRWLGDTAICERSAISPTSEASWSRNGTGARSRVPKGNLTTAEASNTPDQVV
ncbi:nitroreductase family protein [Streptomyces sp. NPDC048577]|uniref:nitroreductase family protein n=1 Tax=Streptomyces sp. NPDC048577 TaxID=3157209 RepID=UPI003418D511